MNSDLSPQDILRWMRETYAKCFSYHDYGQVDTSFSGKARDPLILWTAFIRPDRFRFEHQELQDATPRHRYIIAQDGSKAYSWWDLEPGIEELESLSLGLFGAAGISNGSSCTVPVLLIPECRLGMPFSNLKDLKLLPDSTADGTKCFLIEGSYEFNHLAETIIDGDQKIEVEAMTGYCKEKLWVQKTSFLLLRIEKWMSTNQIPNVETVTTYKPTINAFVPEDKIKFDPPSHT